MTLGDVLLYSFETLEKAIRARQTLLQAGVPGQSMRLSERQDEAGPVEGNFVVGDGKPLRGSPPRPMVVGPEAPYEANFADVENRGVHLLEVRAPDGRMEEIAALLRECDGVDGAARADTALSCASKRSA